MKKNLLLTLVALLCVVHAQAYDFDRESIYYTITSETTVEVANGKYSGTIIIPAEVSYSGIRYSVTSIGSSAFYDCTGLTAITIPNSVTSIGEYAFYGCTGLTSITIPNSVTSIGERAFSDCTGLTSITIPNSVTSIGESAFFYCKGLTSVTIPNSVTSIGDNAFSYVPNIIYYGTATGSPWGAKSMNSYVDGYLVYEDDTKTKLFVCSSAATGEIVIPNSVTSIASYAFDGCTGLTSVTIGNSVTSIGWDAFRGCTGLTSITIPNSVTNIGHNVFRDCTGLTSIVVESGNMVYDSRNNCNAIIETATNTLIQGYKTTIIPNSVTSIASYAFDDCTGLTSITIPNSVTSIGEFAFYGCTGLTSVTIGNSVTSIGNDAFLGCTGLTSIVVESDNVVYDSRNNCNAIIETATNTLIQGCKTTIIPNSVTEIGQSAFSSCTGLTSITIPNSVTEVGLSAFYDCMNLTSVTIGNSVTSIGEWAFYGCTGLTSIVIPNSVTSIGRSAFSDCRGLTSVTIGNSVTSIGNRAFSYCTGLTSITSLAITPPTIDTDVFEEVSTDIPVYVPCGSREAYSMAEEWKSFTNYIEQLTAIVAITSQDENKGIITITKQASCEDNECTFVATAKENYRFVQWSDGNTDNPRTITVTEDITLTAEFEDTSAANVLQTADNQFVTPQKIIRDGQVYILRNGKTYTTTGVEVK